MQNQRTFRPKGITTNNETLYGIFDELNNKLLEVTYKHFIDAEFEAAHLNYVYRSTSSNSAATEQRKGRANIDKNHPCYPYVSMNPTKRLDLG